MFQIMLSKRPVFVAGLIPLLACLVCALVGAAPKPASKPLTAGSLDQALFNAIERADIKRVGALLKQGANVNARGVGGYSPLIRALNKRDVALVKLLLDKGANASASDNYGNTPLSFAIDSDLANNTTFARLLLDHGASVKGRDGALALFLVAMNRDLATAKLLLARGADVNATRERNEQSGETALTAATTFGDLDIMRYLLDKGADVNFQGVLGETPLMYGAIQTEPEVVRLLLNRGAKANTQNKKGETALMLGVESPEIVSLLLARGALVNMRDHEGGTALMQAAKIGRSESVQLLLRAKAAVNEQDNQGATALMQAVKSNVVYGDTIKPLLDYGADINLPDKSGHTVIEQATRRIRPEIVHALLHSSKLSSSQRATLEKAIRSFRLIRAAGNGNAKWVKKMLDEGVDVNARDERGQTALWWAAGQQSNGFVNGGNEPIWQAQYLMVARLLLERGAKTDIPSEDEFEHFPLPLMRARESLPMVQLLVKGGSDLNARNSEGETILMLSAFGYPPPLPVFRFLIAHGADVNARDNDGNTTLLKTQTGLGGYPSWYGPHPEIVRALRAAGADMNAGDKDGYNPLMAAAHSRNLTAIKLFLDNGASIEARDAAGATALHYACRVFIEPTTAASGSASFPPEIAIVRHLLERGADPNASDKTGSTALIEIAKYDYRQLYGPEGYSSGEGRKAFLAWRQKLAVEIARLLLLHGAQANARTTSGNTALKWAAMYGNTTLIQLLKRAGAKTEKIKVM